MMRYLILDCFFFSEVVVVNVLNANIITPAVYLVCKGVCTSFHNFYN